MKITLNSNIIAFENQYVSDEQSYSNDTPIEINLPLSNIDINDEYNLTIIRFYKSTKE